MARACVSERLQSRIDQALAAHRAGDLVTAAHAYEEILATNPDRADIWRLSGFALAGLGKADLAAPALARALAALPDDRPSLGILGAVLLDLDLPKAAHRTLIRTLALSPLDEAAFNNLGNALRRTGKADAALNAYATCLALSPANGAAWLNLGVGLRGIERPFYAVHAYRRARVCRPGWHDAQINLANACQILGDRAQASDLLGDLYAKTGQGRFALKRALLLPIVCENIAEIDQARAVLETTIHELSARDFRLLDPLNEIGQTAFYLSYHDRDDRGLQTGLARLYARACPALLYSADHIARWRGPARARIRVVIISTFLHAHTIGRLNLGLIRNLDRRQFEVIVMRPDRASDVVRKAIDQAADAIISLPDGLIAARTALAELRADIIYYTDIGMEPLTYYLAFARLAPVQALTWGHPDTTGIENLDGFISCAAMEPDGSSNHYSEKLLALPGPTISYTRPEPLGADWSNLGRDAFGLPARSTIYLCPQTPQKLHPDFDAAIASILRRDPQGVLVLVHGLDRFVGQKLVARICRDAPDIANRVIMLGAMPGPKYRRLLALADVILDPFHYSGGHTTLEALDAHTPIVTWPGRFMRGRHTAGFLDLMDLGHQIAPSPAAYVEQALALGQDHDRRRAYSAEIRAQTGALFDRQDAAMIIGDALVSLLDQARGRFS